MARRWAVANVHTGGEIQVRDRLVEIGCEVYCPAYEWTSRPRGRRKPVEHTTAILAGYLFVDHATIGDSEAIIAWSDFHYWLMFAGEWALLPDDALDGLRALETFKVLEQPEKAAMPFEVGQVLRVVDGPFGGMVGEAKLTIPGRVILFGWDFTVPSGMPVELLELDGG